MILKYRCINADITPEVLGKTKGRKIIFESASTDEMKGRFSMVAFDPSCQIELFLDQLVIDGEVVEVDAPYEKLEQLIADMKCEVPTALKHLPFISGLMGYCSFDMIRHQFPSLQLINNEQQIPDIKFHGVESVYVFDHYKDQLFIIATNLFSRENETEVQHRLERMIERLSEVPLFAPLLTHERWGETTANISEAEFMKEIEHYQQLIVAGDMFQVVPSRIYQYEHFFDGNDQLKYQLYMNLKRQNPSPYMYFIEDDETIIGSSPESFIKRIGSIVTTNPIAGTIRRGVDEDEDRVNEQTLLNDEKELAEHRMLVDLGRNDINRIAKKGTVHLPKLMLIERFEHVMHIVSVVEGEIKDGIEPLDIIAALMPAGTVSGAPKLRAITRIYEMRPVQRGIYAGGIGYINCNHDLDFALTIRTMRVDEHHVYVEAGCGVVYDSVPSRELQETKIKAKSLLEVRP